MTCSADTLQFNPMWENNSTFGLCINKKAEKTSLCILLTCTSLGRGKVAQHQADSCPNTPLHKHPHGCRRMHWPARERGEPSEKVKGCGSVVTGPPGHGHRWRIISHPLWIMQRNPPVSAQARITAKTFTQTQLGSNGSSSWLFRRWHIDGGAVGPTVLERELRVYASLMFLNNQSNVR